MGNIFYYETDIGKIGIIEQDGNITELLLPNSNPPVEKHTARETEVLQQAGRQLLEYFRGERKKFKLPLKPAGTKFMQLVWAELLKIPYGETRSYGDIAKNVGHDKAYRAVGLANNRNPIPIFVPCHRVIGAKGELVGYGGGLSVKEYLLQLEQMYKKNKT